MSIFSRSHLASKERGCHRCRSRGSNRWSNASLDCWGPDPTCHCLAASLNGFPWISSPSMYVQMCSNVAMRLNEFEVFFFGYGSIVHTLGLATCWWLHAPFLEGKVRLGVLGHVGPMPRRTPHHELAVKLYVLQLDAIVFLTA